MDGTAFDRLARIVGASATRRGTLGAALAALIAAGAGQDAPAKRRKKCKPPCAEGFRCVKGRCTCESGVDCGGVCCASGEACVPGGGCRRCDVTVRPGESLQDGVEAAPAGGTLCLEAGTFAVDASTIVLKSLNIVGAGRVQTTIDCGNQANAFIVGVPGEVRAFDVRIGGLTIRDGGVSILGENGGAISAYGPATGSLRVQDVAIDGASRTGIYAWGVQTMVHSCTIRNIDSTRDGGGIQQWEGSLVVFNSTIADNVAPSGGGIRCDSADCEIHGCLVETNNATGTAISGPFHLDGGGGIDFSGGAFGATLRVIDTRVIGNAAALDGGGIRAAGDLDTTRVDLENATVTGNTANGAALPGIAGGGVFATGANLTVAFLGSTEVSGNVAGNCAAANGAAFDPADPVSAGFCAA